MRAFSHGRRTKPKTGGAGAGDGAARMQRGPQMRASGEPASGTGNAIQGVTVTVPRISDECPGNEQKNV